MLIDAGGGDGGTPCAVLGSDRTIVHVDLPAAGPACMGVPVRGADGPLHLYSKEHGGSSLAGMRYVKVLPDAGYRYHMYTLNRATFGYGVNEAGLSTSGATINCDANTERVGNQETQRRLDRGQATAPMGMHMLLAMCADVDQAGCAR